MTHRHSQFGFFATLGAPMLVGLLAACGSDAPPAQAPDAAPDAAPPDSPVSVACPDADVVALLNAVPGVVDAQKVDDCGDGVGSGATCYTFGFTQPLHHDRTATGTFTQQVSLVHRGCDRPTVLADWGYESFGLFDIELSLSYDANMIHVEHRFQGESVPAIAAWDWTALTIKNGAADQHAIITALKSIYRANWVVTGASKGGVTSLYHRYFYPDDVNGTVAYVAPASHSPIDPGYQTYMAANFPQPCYDNLINYEKAALSTRRNMMLARLGGDDYALDYGMAYLDWGLWQYKGSSFCSTVPTIDAADDVFFQFFDRARDPTARRQAITPGDSRSDSALSYEWLTEQGFALQIPPGVQALLEFPPPTMPEAFAEANPEVTLPAYDGSVTNAMRAWVRDQATDVLMIYGGVDPWTGGMVDVPTQPTSLRLIAQASTHNASISRLNASDKQNAILAVNRMMGEAKSNKRMGPADQARLQVAADALAAYLARPRGLGRR